MQTSIIRCLQGHSIHMHRNACWQDPSESNHTYTYTCLVQYCTYPCCTPAVPLLYLLYPRHNVLHVHFGVWSSGMPTHTHIQYKHMHALDTVCKSSTHFICTQKCTCTAIAHTYTHTHLHTHTHTDAPTSLVVNSWSLNQSKSIWFFPFVFPLAFRMSRRSVNRTTNLGWPPWERRRRE